MTKRLDEKSTGLIKELWDRIDVLEDGLFSEKNDRPNKDKNPDPQKILNDGKDIEEFLNNNSS